MAAPASPVAVAATRAVTAATKEVKAAAASAIEDLRFNQPWTYYSTLVIDDWSKVDTHVLSFWQDTRGSKGLARTNIAQPGQIPEAFRAYGVSIRIGYSMYDDPRYFELICNWSAIELKVGSDEMIDGPVVQFPAGGGPSGTIEVGMVEVPTNPMPGVSGGSDVQAPPQNQGPTVIVADMAVIGDLTGGGSRRKPGTAAALPGDPSGAVPPVSGGPYPSQRPLSVLTNGVPHRSNIYQFAHDPIKIKKGSTISTDFVIDRGAFSELLFLNSRKRPMSPGIMIQISLEGRRARAAGYGTGG